jgi:hypothetical protein
MVGLVACGNNSVTAKPQRLRGDILKSLFFLLNLCRFVPCG